MFQTQKHQQGRLTKIASECLIAIFKRKRSKEIINAYNHLGPAKTKNIERLRNS